MKRTNKTKMATRQRPGTLRYVLGGFFLCLFLFMPGTAKASHCFPGCCDLVSAEHAITRQVVISEHNHLRLEAFGFSAGILPFPAWPSPPANTNRLQTHELWLLDVFLDEYIGPAMMMMSEQLVSVMMKQMFIIGAFFDAKNQMETQRLFQELTTKAHKDYHPSFGMCEIGTNTRSLAAAEFEGEFSMMVLNKRFMDRQLGNGSSVGAGGPEIDRLSDDTRDVSSPYNRLGYFLQNTCDDNDLNKVPTRDMTGMWLCTESPPEMGWVNRDIDWNNTIMAPRIINVEFDRDATDNSRVFEMANYLYGHRVFTRPQGEMLFVEQNQDNFLDSRAVTAKRSVAQNSFDAIVGLKSKGTHPRDSRGRAAMSSEDSGDYMRMIMVALGFTEEWTDEAMIQNTRYQYHKNEEMEGLSLHPQMSYYSQMEMLAKKLYQRPEFYTNLYDKPANVKRKSAAMQAIKTMLERDIFDSQLRSEAIMSMILELKVIEEQQNVENKLGLMKERFR